VTHRYQMRLDALLAERAGELLEALLGNDPSLTALKQLLFEQTEANPSSSRRVCGPWWRRRPLPASAAPTG